MYRERARESTPAGEATSREELRAANRALLRAIEKPPETGVEDRLDDLAAETWFLAEHRERPPDQGRLARIERALGDVADGMNDRKARYVTAARRHLRAYRAAVPSV